MFLMHVENQYKERVQEHEVLGVGIRAGPTDTGRHGGRMNRRLWIVGIGALVLSACGAAVGVGDGAAGSMTSVSVNTSSTKAVRQAVIEVFGEQGFKVRNEATQSITFTKAGGPSADLAWGTLGNSNPVMIRPTVTWRSSGAQTVWVGCQVEVAQQSTVFGETVRQPLAVGKAAYRSMLGQVKKRAEGNR